MQNCFSVQFREIAALNDVDVVEGDFDTSAHREREKAKLSSVEEGRKTTLLSLPPDLVPMWGQNEDSGDCCGFSSKHEECYKLVGCQAWKSSVLQRKTAYKGDSTKMRTSLSSCTSAKFTLLSEVQAALGTQQGKRGDARRREKKKRQARVP